MTINQLISTHPDMRHMYTREVKQIVAWMVANFQFIEDYTNPHGEVNMTAIAEETIVECPYVDENDEDVWQSDAGGVWDAAYVFSTWVEETP